MTIAGLVDFWRGRKYRIFKTDIRGSSVSGGWRGGYRQSPFFSLSFTHCAIFILSVSTVDGAGPFGPIPLNESLPTHFP